MEHKDMTYLLSSRLGGELAGSGSVLDAEADDAGDPRARAALPGDAAPTLNAAQLEAVTATEGYVRVIAGAGTGKTRALTERFAYLVNDLGIMPENILCVTFTNKAANEMRHRIRALTGDNDTGFINTFHGFCVSVLQEDSHAVQYPKSFLVLDNADIDQMLQIIYDERGLTLRDMTFGRARDMIEIMKLKERPDYYRDLLAMPLASLHEKYEQATDVRDIIFYGYLYQEKKCFAFDYNDLIVVVLYIFSQHPDIKLKWQKRLEYVMVDEFQDIDKLQYKLMNVLAGYHKNLFVVGDPDQTIYTWRGADVRFLLDFDKAFPDTRTIMMLENYRSTPEVIAVANSLIEKNRQRIPKDLRACRTQHGPTVWHHAKTSDDEAKWIAEGVRALHDGGIRYRDMAVLYRAHYASRPVEEAFLKAEIPHAVYSGVPFYGRKEIKDSLAYLRLTGTTSPSCAWQTLPSAISGSAVWRFLRITPRRTRARFSRRSSRRLRMRYSNAPRRSSSWRSCASSADRSRAGRCRRYLRLSSTKADTNRRFARREARSDSTTWRSSSSRSTSSRTVAGRR